MGAHRKKDLHIKLYDFEHSEWMEECRKREINASSRLRRLIAMQLKQWRSGR